MTTRESSEYQKMCARCGEWKPLEDFNNARRLLCTNCNSGIGKLGDNLDGVMNAVRYLEKSV